MRLVLSEGECEEATLAFLLRRLSSRSQLRLIPDVLSLKGKSNILRIDKGFEDTVQRKVEEGYEDFIILLDSDVTFSPYRDLNEERIGIQERASDLSQCLGVSIQPFWMERTYDSWFVGGLAGIGQRDIFRNLGTIPGDTQAFPEDAERWIMSKLKSGRYNTDIQRSLSAIINITEALRRNNSFARFRSLVFRTP